MTEQLYFAHANSFPASVYHKMLGALANDYCIIQTDCIGHDPAYPVTDCWPQLVAEAIACIEQQASHPVIGVGHSLGGVLMLYAAVARPDLFKSLVILDAPLLGPWRAGGIWLAKKLGFIKRVTPGGNTLSRRDCWASTAMVAEYFARKTMFARFDPDCLHDYAEYGTVDDGEGGRRLKFRPVIEHAIYCTLPHDIAHCAGQLSLPACYIAAEQSPALRPSDFRFIQRALGMRVLSQYGSHLFPLEYPLETARLIHQQIQLMHP